MTTEKVYMDEEGRLIVSSVLDEVAMAGGEVVTLYSVDKGFISETTSANPDDEYELLGEL